MVYSSRSGVDGVDRSRNSNPSIHLRSPRSKIRKDVEQHGMKQIGLPISKEEFEALVRKVVREEVSQALCLHAPLQRSPLYEAEPSVARSFLLCFEGRLPNRVFTGNKIEAEGTEPLKIVLQDAKNGTVVSDGPFASMRIECVVLEGDFKAEETTNWTEKEFSDNILREREGRRPLLVGERSITLSNGVGFIRDISFTDNSSWVRSKRFRLGFKVAQGLFPDVGVQEAISDAFEVKDRRGEPYQKHGTPSLDDMVWRLSKIAKDGPNSKRLAANGIRTVKDFLQRYYIDESFLRSILGVSNRVWEAIVEHAKSCSLNNDHYSYFSADDGVGLLFNCVLKIIGVTYDGQNYQPLETLNKAQKLQVDKIRRYAYQHQSQLIPTDVPATSSYTSSPCEPIVPSTTSSLTDLHLLEGTNILVKCKKNSRGTKIEETISCLVAELLADQSQKDMDYDYTESHLPYPLGIEQSHHHLGESMNDQLIRVPSMIGDLYTGFSETEPTWYSNLPPEPSSPSVLFSGEDNIFHVHTSAWHPMTPSSMAESNGMLMASTSNTPIGTPPLLPKFDNDLLHAGKKANVGCSNVQAALTVKVRVGKDGNCGSKKGKLPSYN
ncbi:hypothetical protein V2J09_023598 [Rumex salicifolius]